MTVLKIPTTASPGHELLQSALAQLDPGMHRFLQRPERTLIVALPATMDDGRLEVFTGYRVQHSTGRGPGKGGCRDITVRCIIIHSAA